uniref:Uncharacterized protein n=1 Tax=Eutreptiella gymnastica TaxID=73025 RepID=A0A6T1Y382_9EUGL
MAQQQTNRRCTDHRWAGSFTQSHVRDALEVEGVYIGVFKSGCKKRLGGKFRRVQNGWRAVGRGQKPLAGLILTQGGAAPLPPFKRSPGGHVPCPSSFPWVRCGRSSTFADLRFWGDLRH